jgi:hypothetical protein
MTQELTINGKTYERHWVTGKVTGASKHLETRISGGGGGGYTHNGTGFSSTAPITSQTVTHDQIFIADGSGKEHTLKLQNWDIAAREGHEMSAIWLIKKGKKSGPYVAIQNHTTDELSYNDAELSRLHRPTWALLALVAPIFIDSLGFVIATGALVFWWVQGVRGRNAIKASGRLLAVGPHMSA